MADKVIFLTTTGLSSWQVPSDWTDVNTIECIGGGGAGGAINATLCSATGGGGGAYSKKNNLTGLTPGQSVLIQVGAGGAAQAISGNPAWAPTNLSTAIPSHGGPTRFNDVLSTTTVSAEATPGALGNAYTLVARAQTIPNASTVTKIGTSGNSAATVSVRIMWRTSTGHYTPVYTQSYSHGGTGWEDCTLSTPFVVPATGAFYVAIYNGSWGGTAETNARAYYNGDASTLGNDYTFTEDNTGGSPARWTGYSSSAASCLAMGGWWGEVVSISTPGKNGGVGGDKATGIGDIKNSGGRGGNYIAGSNGRCSTGGGGAAGKNGDGVAGVDLTGSVNPQASAGGNADASGAGAGTGSAGSTSGNPSDGGSGNEYTQTSDSATAGPGGGGGGVWDSTNRTAGSGGLYGGGGGGAASSGSGTETPGAGAQGIIVVTYTPAIFNPGTSPFRIRLSLENTGATQSGEFELFVKKNSGSYSAVTTSSTAGVISYDASTDADDTVIRVPRLTPFAS